MVLAQEAAQDEKVRDVVLDVRDLRTYLYTRWGVTKAVDGVSFLFDGNAGFAVSACVGDVWMITKLRRFSDDLLVRDCPSEIGCDVYSQIAQTSKCGAAIRRRTGADDPRAHARARAPADAQ